MPMAVIINMQSFPKQIADRCNCLINSHINKIITKKLSVAPTGWSHNIFCDQSKENTMLIVKIQISSKSKWKFCFKPSFMCLFKKFLTDLLVTVGWNKKNMA